MKEQLPLVLDFASRTRGWLEFNIPDATAMAFMRWRGPGNTTDLCRRLLEKRSVLVVDGNLLGMTGYIRVWLGAPRDRLVDGLARFASELGELRT